MAPVARRLSRQRSHYQTYTTQPQAGDTFLALSDWCLVTCGLEGMCLSHDGTRADVVPMTITAEHIYNKICDSCDRPALTFDCDDHAFCPTHAKTIVRALPVEDELPVAAQLSGWSAFQGDPTGRSANGR